MSEHTVYLQLAVTAPADVSEAFVASQVNVTLGERHWGAWIVGNATVCPAPADENCCPTCGTDDWDFLVNDDAVCENGHRWTVAVEDDEPASLAAACEPVQS